MLQLSQQSAACSLKHPHPHPQTKGARNLLYFIIPLKQTQFWFKCTAELDNWVTSGIKRPFMTDYQLVTLCGNMGAHTHCTAAPKIVITLTGLRDEVWTLVQYPPGDCGLSFTPLSPPLAARLHERARVRMNAHDWTINSGQLIYFFNYPVSAVLWAWMPYIKNHTNTHTNPHCWHAHTPYLLVSPCQARLLLGCPCALQESIKTSDFLTNTLLVDKMTSICCLSDVSGKRYVFHEKIKNNGLWVRAGRA